MTLTRAQFFSLLLLFFAFNADRVRAAQLSPDTRTALPEQIARNRRDWGTDLDVGTTLARGNVDQNSADANIGLFRNFGQWTSFILGDWRYTSYNNKHLENRGSGTLRIDYHLSAPDSSSPQWRIVAFTTHAFNETLKLNYRNTVGVGPWVDFDTERFKNGISLLPTHRHQHYQGYNVEDRWTISLRYVVSFVVTDNAEVGFDFFYVPAFSDFDDRRIFFSPYIEAFVWEKIIGLKLKSRTEYDSRPKPGVKAADTELTAALSFHFGK